MEKLALSFLLRPDDLSGYYHGKDHFDEPDSGSSVSIVQKKVIAAKGALVTAAPDSQPK
jgi:hypothetical protein